MSNIEVHSRRTSHPTAFRPWTTLPKDVIAKETVEPMGTDAVDKPHSLLSKLMAEAIGPMMLVFFGSLSALKSNSDNVLTHAAFAHGLTIFVMVNSLGHVSGGHFNPAVSFAAALAGKLHPYLVLPYWIAVTQKSEFDAIMGGATILSPDDKWYQGLLAEAVLTFLLTFVVLNSAIDRDNVLAPLAIGFSLTICIFGAGSISGASMNPARSLGPCVAANLFIDNVDTNFIWNFHYIYWIGPLLGAAISALIYRSFFARSGRLLP
ncbi:hypothetical protein M3Y96_00659800 [Aphelenchoides besseyi]|nr:hypothetical protein M3Y96_00659800 [Aphelenchoides besseyi]